MNWFAAHLARLEARGKLQVRAAAPSGSLSSGQAAVVAVSSLGVGLFPWAPATVASAATVAVAFLAGERIAPQAWLVIAAVTLAVGIPAGTLAEKRLATSDPRWFILDEVAGQAMFFVFLPPTLPYCAAAFVLFRAFDVLKLPPGERLERLPGGWGIMLDDILAGLYGTAILVAGRALLRLA